MKRILRLLAARNLFVVLVVVPLLASAVYLYAFAADRYVSESVVAVRQAGEQPIGLEGLSSLFQVSGGGTRQDALLLLSHIHSMDMLRMLDERLKLREHFSAPRSDLLFRLEPDASREAFLDYYRNRVEVRFDDTSGLLILQAQGFSPQQALELNRSIVEFSERFINGISHQLAREQMAFAERELAKARTEHEAAKEAVFKFQDRHRMLDPMAQAQANTGMTVELQSSLVRLEAEMKRLQSFMTPGSPQVQALREQIAALRSQLSDEAARGTASDGGSRRLNALAAEFRGLQTTLNLSEMSFKSALTSLQSARVESTRKMKSLVLVESPTEPQRPEQPQRAYLLLAIALGLLLVFGIARLAVATIEDHLD